MHETTIIGVTLYALFGATIGASIVYIQHLASKYFSNVKAKILKQKEKPPIEWD